MRRRATNHILESLQAFSRYAAPRPLRQYQLEAGDAIVRSVLKHEGKAFSVLMARQSGKNELAAQVEAYLLHMFASSGGQIVKAAPSYHPQIVNSVIRLREILSTPFSNESWSSRHGHAIELRDARIMFFSADPAANVVGATASILLEIDEAQDVSADVYWRNFRPMASTTNATTVLYGTAWDEDNLLEQLRRHNLAHEARTGERLNFEFPWTVLGALSPAYDTFVRGEIERLGVDHPIIQTQYLLEVVPSAGRLLSAELLEKLRGQHYRQTAPLEGTVHVAGIDIAGQVTDLGPTTSARLLNQRDDTVITIASVEFGATSDLSRLPNIQVVEHYRWRGVSHVEQYDRMERILADVWQVALVSIDATGVGAGVSSFLYRSLPTRLDPVVFTSKSKSELGFSLLAAVETDRLKLYRGDDENIHELWKQLRFTRYRLRGSEEMEFSVPTSEGHDDFVISLALAVRAAESIAGPSFGGIIRSRPGADDLSEW